MYQRTVAILSDKGAVTAIAAVIALLAWTGVTSEAYTSFGFSKSVGRTPTHSVIFFYRFFTNQIITILACVMTLTAVRLSLHGKLLNEKVYAAITVYVSITSATYELMLRRLWSPEGFWLLRDALMHDLLPLLMLLFWVFVSPKQNLTWSDPLIWLVYPGAYLMATLAAGYFGEPYPYAFLDPAMDGCSWLAVRVCVLTAAFYGVGLALVGLSRLAR